MTRPTYRRTPKLECLEKREVLSGPTADQQYMLQLINLVRTDPSAAAQRFTTNLDPTVIATLNYYNVNIQQVEQKIADMTPQPPLAWNDQLAEAAQGHSQDMSNTGTQSHLGSDGSTPAQRISAAGYNANDETENAYGYATSLDEAMQAFLIDWGVSSDGHLDNIMQPGVAADQAFRDVGIGIVQSTTPGFGPLVITQDFGSEANEQAQLLGVAFNDLNGDNFYEQGEGQAGVTIEATNLATGQTSTTQTQTAGGYEMPLAPGNYDVTAILNNQVIRSQNLTVGNVNIEVDYNLSQPWQGGTPPAVSTSNTPAAQVVNTTPAPTIPVTPASTPTPQVSAPVVVTIPTNNTNNTNNASTPATAPLTASKLFNSFLNLFSFNNGSSWTASQS